jgi:hypothetical protein
MKLPTYQFAAQIVAAFTVVVSLGFVAYELKQARDVATAELTISVIAMESEITHAVLDAESYNSGIYKFEVSGEELTHMEKRDRERVAFLNLLGSDAKHLLWSSGLLTDGEWEFERAEILRQWNSLPHVRPTSDEPEIYGRQAFTDEMNDLWSRRKIEYPAQHKEWLADLAAAKAEQAAEEAAKEAEEEGKEPEE